MKHNSHLKIMFVCTGNICRSPLAHRLFEKKAAERGLADTFHVESSGTDAYHVGEQADSRMRSTARDHGLDLHHFSQRLRRSDLEEFDLIFVMAGNHRRAVSRMTDSIDVINKLYLFREFDPAVNERLRTPDVPDPWYGSREGFEEVWHIVDRTCDVILDRIEEGALP